MRDERLPFRPVVEVNLARSGRVHSPELGFCTLSVDLINFRSSWPVPLTHRVGPEGRSLSLLYKTRGAKGLRGGNVEQIGPEKVTVGPSTALFCQVPAPERHGAARARYRPLKPPIGSICGLI